MSKRINIVLPDTTIAVLDRVTTKGNRSRFIDRAVRHLIETEGRANLRARLRAEAVENAERDLNIAAEWFPLEEEATALGEKCRSKSPLAGHHDNPSTGRDLSRRTRSEGRP